MLTYHERHHDKHICIKSMKKKDMIFVIKDNLKIYTKTAIFV